MTDYWRGDPAKETPMGRWLRERWERDSVYVLDIDHLICDPNVHHGLLIEEKHVSERNRNSRVTRRIARNNGWWAALLVYHTDDGGNVTRIDATFWPPQGATVEKQDMPPDWFDEWVCREFGAKPRIGLGHGGAPSGSRRDGEYGYELEETPGAGPGVSSSSPGADGTNRGVAAVATASLGAGRLDSAQTRHVGLPAGGGVGDQAVTSAAQHPGDLVRHPADPEQLAFEGAA